MPSILYMKHGKTNKCVVLRWVVGNDAMLIDPREGLVKTGELDEETAVMLSNTEGAPKLAPE